MTVQDNAACLRSFHATGMQGFARPCCTQFLDSGQHMLQYLGPDCMCHMWNIQRTLLLILNMRLKATIVPKLACLDACCASAASCSGQYLLHYLACACQHAWKKLCQPGPACNECQSCRPVTPRLKIL